MNYPKRKKLSKKLKLSKNHELSKKKKIIQKAEIIKKNLNYPNPKLYEFKVDIGWIMINLIVDLNR